MSRIELLTTGEGHRIQTRYHISKIDYEIQILKTDFQDNGEDTYDAYEEDIAFATFYFEDPTVFEYTR